MAQDDKDKKHDDKRPKGRPEPADTESADNPPPPPPPPTNPPGGGQSHDPEGGGQG